MKNINKLKEIDINPFTPARNLAKYQRNILVLYGPYVGISILRKNFFDISSCSAKN